MWQGLFTLCPAIFLWQADLPESFTNFVGFKDITVGGLLIAAIFFLNKHINKLEAREKEYQTKIEDLQTRLLEQERTHNKEMRELVDNFKNFINEKNK